MDKKTIRGYRLEFVDRRNDCDPFEELKLIRKENWWSAI